MARRHRNVLLAGRPPAWYGSEGQVQALSTPKTGRAENGSKCFWCYFAHRHPFGAENRCTGSPRTRPAGVGHTQAYPRSRVISVTSHLEILLTSAVTCAILKMLHA